MNLFRKSLVNCSKKSADLFTKSFKNGECEIFIFKKLVQEKKNHRVPYIRQKLIPKSKTKIKFLKTGANLFGLQTSSNSSLGHKPSPEVIKTVKFVSRSLFHMLRIFSLTQSCRYG